MDRILQSMVALGELRLEEVKSYREDLLTHLAQRASENSEQIQEDLKKVGRELEEGGEKELAVEDLSEKIRKIAERVKETESL